MPPELACQYTGGAKPTLHKDMPELARDYDIVLIDGAPR